MTVVNTQREHEAARKPSDMSLLEFARQIHRAVENSSPENRADAIIDRMIHCQAISCTSGLDRAEARLALQTHRKLHDQKTKSATKIILPN